QIATSPALLGTALALGVATSLIAATIPARNAARVDPVQALQKGKYQVLSAGEKRLRAILAIVVGAISIALLSCATIRPLFYLGFALAIVAALLLTPLLSVALTQAMRPALKWMRPVEGTLAADSLIQAPRRTSASVAALMLSLTLVVGFAGMARASYSSIIEWMNVTLNPDLFVMPGKSFVIRTVRFPPEVGEEIASMPGVKVARVVRDARIVFRKTPIMIVAVDIHVLERTSPIDPIAGDRADMYRRTAAGEGLMVSENLAALQHLSLGEILELPSPNGVIRLPVVGIVVDYSDQQGTIVMDRSVFIKYWHDDSLNAVGVFLKPGEDAQDVRRRILEQYTGRRSVFVFTNPELRSYILKITDQWFGLTSIQIVVAVLVAILGI